MEIRLKGYRKDGDNGREVDRGNVRHWGEDNARCMIEVNHDGRLVIALPEAMCSVIVTWVENFRQCGIISSSISTYHDQIDNNSNNNRRSIYWDKWALHRIYSVDAIIVWIDFRHWFRLRIKKLTEGYFKLYMVALMMVGWWVMR